MSTSFDVTHERLLNKKETAEFLGCSESLLDQFRSKRDGGPPWVKIGKGLVRYRLSDLLAYLDKCRQEPMEI